MFNRRNLLGAAAAGAIGIAANSLSAQDKPQSKPDKPFQVTNGQIRQSVMGWCFKPMSAENLAKACKEIGIVALEGVPRESYGAIRKLGLDISLVSSHGFKEAFVNPKHHEASLAKLREAIDVAVEVGSPSVITFTGMREEGIDDEQAEKNCIAGWKQIVGYAEKQKINLVLEHLNSRDDTHPMKGHPGYFGDDVDHCVRMINQVGSPRMKLLFDCYHVQVMNGDVIRRIGQYKDVIGHYHTAGNPGRGELDDTQEMNYPPIMKAILATGYKGFVAQEFIPTWNDPIAALRHAAEVCDV